MQLEVNLDEFSELCGVTAETMRGYIRAVEGSPKWLIERGERGRGYRIEPRGGVRWWKARRKAEETVAAERQEQLNQLRLELQPGLLSEDEVNLSGRQRREEYAATYERLRLAEKMGALVEVAQLMPRLMAAAVETRRRLMLVPAEFGALLGLPPEDVAKLEEIQARAVEELTREFTAAVKAPVVPSLPEPDPPA